MKFKTVSGSHYEIVADRIRRLNPMTEKRGDGEWIKLVRVPYVAVGERVVLTLVSLSKYGADDYGTPISQDSPETVRITSTVVEVSYEAE